jgi:RNA recognition motif-containing protein
MQRRERVERESIRRENVREARVKPKKGPNEVQQRRGGRHLDQVTTSFFVSKFPEEVSNTDLWKLFIPFGRVGEVFIPKKLDKWGQRFAFVKFWEVRNAEELEAELQDVW